MPNPLKAFAVAKGAAGEFKRHPISTPMVAVGGVLALLEIDGYIRRYERRQFDEHYRIVVQQVAEQKLLAEQVSVTLPEISPDD